MINAEDIEIQNIDHFMTYVHATFSWRSWRLGGKLNQYFWQFLRKSCF